MSGNAAVQRFSVTSPKMMDVLWDSYSARRPTEEAARTGRSQLAESSAEFLQKSPFKVNWPNFWESAVETSRRYG